MWARVARFEGDPADIDARLQRLRAALDRDFGREPWKVLTIDTGKYIDVIHKTIR